MSAETARAEPLTDHEIADLCRRLALLLNDDSGRGMASWHAAVATVGRALHTALGEALGPASDTTKD